MTASRLLNYPFDPATLLRKKRSLQRELADRNTLVEKRIAILGGSTTAELKDFLQLFLLDSGIRPTFYESQYNRYYEDLSFGNPELVEFQPEIVYIHTTNKNLTRFPTPEETPAGVEQLLADEVGRFEALWSKASDSFGCAVIQNNMDPPLERPLGNLDSVDVRGRSHFIRAINQRFAEHAAQTGYLHINDIEYLASWLGLAQWHDRRLWYTAKYAMSLDAVPHLANNLAGIVRSICGLAKKCLVLDLDNTLWGGVIGDDGLAGIQLGRETAEAEAFSDFQAYLSDLKRRGVLLAVCSKNEDVNAREGFSHPDSVLRFEDFSCFKANWDRKDQNIQAIAAELNIGVDSLVFVDDNQAERELVSAQLPEVTVPDFGSEVSRYIDIIDKGGFFETLSLSNEDLQRANYYTANAQRQSNQAKFEDYGQFLESLDMVAEIQPFAPVYLERITQLINKTNQFNLTTRRYTHAEVEAFSTDDRYLTLYGKLKDKFGENGLVSLVIAKLDGDRLDIDTWLMSCRVLKRDMERAMFDQLVERAAARGVRELTGTYLRTAKNDMVSKFFGELGFECTSREGDAKSFWRYVIEPGRVNANRFIKVNPDAPGG